MPEDEMAGVPDMQTQLDELKSRLDDLEREVYGDEGPGGAEPGPGRMKSPGLAILIGKGKEKGGK